MLVAPEFIIDKAGNRVNIGDRIAYAAGVGSSSTLNIGILKKIRRIPDRKMWTPNGYTSAMALKISIDVGEGPIRTIEEWRKRYVKVYTGPTHEEILAQGSDNV